jgi:glycosyltransferase involved in cell wall biosynthesis
MTTVAVIPAFNEQDALPLVLDELRSTGYSLTPLVVDDGSNDATAEVAQAAGAVVLKLPFNLGYGGAKRAGLRWAVENGATQVVVIDADGQHNPNDISVLLAELSKGTGLVIGSRFHSGSERYDGAGATRRVAMRSIAWMVRLTTGLRSTDATSGFHAMSQPVLRLLADDNPIEYLSDPVTSIYLVHAAGHRIAEVPVSMRERAGGVPSARNIRLIVSFLRLLVDLAGVVAVSRLRRRQS